MVHFSNGKVHGESPKSQEWLQNLESEMQRSVRMESWWTSWWTSGVSVFVGGKHQNSSWLSLGVKPWLTHVENHKKCCLSVGFYSIYGKSLGFNNDWWSTMVIYNMIKWDMDMVTQLFNGIELTQNDGMMTKWVIEWKLFKDGYYGTCLPPVQRTTPQKSWWM